MAVTCWLAWPAGGMSTLCKDVVIVCYVDVGCRGVRGVGVGASLTWYLRVMNLVCDPKFIL